MLPKVTDDTIQVSFSNLGRKNVMPAVIVMGSVQIKQSLRGSCMKACDVFELWARWLLAQRPNRRH